MRSNRELSVLHEIAEALNREADLNSALQVSLGRIVELFELRTGWIFLIDENTEETYLAAHQNLPPALANEPERMQGTCYCLDTYHDGDMDGAANVSVITCTRLKNLDDGTEGLRFHASIPLYNHHQKLGMLNVVSRDWQEISQDDLHLLYTVGEVVSMSIQRARLFDKSHELGAVSERNRLAREIHDTLAQGLTAVILQLETTDVLLDTKNDVDKARKTLQTALDLTRKNLEEVRRSVLDLRALPLEGKTLAEALIDLSTDLHNEYGIKIHVDCQSSNVNLPSRIASGLYRMAQEAVNNVIQHANAERVRINLSIIADQIELSIEDDGSGFDVDSIPVDRFGLIGISERAKLLGGKASVQTTVNEGTRLQINVPYTSIS